MKTLIAVIVMYLLFIGVTVYAMRTSEARILKTNLNAFNIVTEKQASVEAILNDTNNNIHDIKEVCYGLREAGE